MFCTSLAACCFERPRLEEAPNRTFPAETARRTSFVPRAAVGSMDDRPRAELLANEKGAGVPGSNGAKGPLLCPRKVCSLSGRRIGRKLSILPKQNMSRDVQIILFTNNMLPGAPQNPTNHPKSLVFPSKNTVFVREDRDFWFWGPVERILGPDTRSRTRPARAPHTSAAVARLCWCYPSQWGSWDPGGTSLGLDTRAPFGTPVHPAKRCC